MKTILLESAYPNREPSAPASSEPPFRLTALASLLFLAVPLFGQYTGKNVTPTGSTAAGLASISPAGGTSVGSNGLSHAIVYDNNLNQTTDLNPVGMAASTAKGTDGIEQVGYSRNYMYANCTIWKGTAASAIYLTPSGASSSWCVGTDGGKEIGWDYRPFYIYVTQHAILWSGSANSYIDLHAGGATYSRGRAIHGNEQVGEIDSVASTDPETINMYNSQAVLWHGTAASMVFLNPAGYVSSGALATNGSQEGGWAKPTNNATAHAMMWSGSAASAVDLHPAGYFDSRVTAISATTQVGDAWVGGAAHSAGAHRHALSWAGSAASVVDLHVFVPPDYTDSVATGIDSAGNVVGYAFKTATMGDHLPIDAIAVVFAATPGPPAPISSLSLSPARVNPGDTLTGVVTLANPATTGGATVTFISDNPALLPTPVDVQVPEGATSASFLTPVASAPLAAITAVNVIGVTGSYRRAASVMISPVVGLSALTVNPVQGGNQTFGTVKLNLPAIAPVTVSLSADNPAITIPSSVTIALGQSSQTFTITAAIVTAPTPVTVTASYNGTALQAVENVSTSVPIVLSSLTVPSVIGGQTFAGTVTLNHPAYLGGVTISVTTSDPVLAPVPATITIPYGSSTGYITGVAGAVVNSALISLTASLNGVTVSGSFTISNGPGATIQSLDYWSVSHLIKVTATTTMPSGTLTFGTSPNGPALGLLAIEPTTGMYQGSASMSSPPSVIWVWNSAGGLPVSSTAVRVRSK